MTPEYAYTSLHSNTRCPTHGERVVRVDYVEGMPVYACSVCLGEGKLVRPPDILTTAAYAAEGDVK